MSIPKKPLGNWGTMLPVNDNSHITLTNENSWAWKNLGSPFHVTTQIGSTSVHDYFDSEGNYLGYNINDNSGK